MLSASSSSMNEFLQQISSPTWLEAKHQVSKGGWNYDRMSECLRQRTHWGNRDGKPLSVSWQSPPHLWPKNPNFFPHSKEKPLLSLGQNNPVPAVSPHVLDWKDIHTFLAVGAVPQILWTFYPELSAGRHWTVIFHTWVIPAGSLVVTYVLRC